MRNSFSETSRIRGFIVIEKDLSNTHNACILSLIGNEVLSDNFWVQLTKQYPNIKKKSKILLQ